MNKPIISRDEAVEHLVDAIRNLTPHDLEIYYQDIIGDEVEVQDD